MDEAKTMTVDEALDALELDALDVVAQVRRLRAKHTAALKAAREEGGAEMREACARIADACASERRRTLARWDEEGVPADDARRTWVYCKASEAERIRDAIRSLAALPLDGDGGEPVAQLAAVTAERDDARAALATARREGAEGMRWEASEAAEQWLREVAEVTEDSPADLADAIRALPLDGDGGAT